MIIFILYTAYKNKSSLHFSTIFIPLIIYAVFALLSSIISEHRSYSFTGNFEQFESIFVILGYCLIVYYAYLFVQSERDLKYILYALLISIIFFGLLGLTQITDHDFYKTQIGWGLISNSTYRNMKDSFDFLAGAKRVYLSFYNTNYVGVYVSLVLPIIFLMIIFSKKTWFKLLSIIALAGLVLCLYGSLSTAGFIGIVFAILLSVVMLWRYLLKYYFISVSVIILVIIALFIFNQNTDNYIGNQITKIMNIQKSSPSLTEIQTNNDELVIKYKDNTLRTIFYIDESGYCFFNFKDGNKNPISSTFDTLNGPVTIQDERFPGFVFTPVMNGETIGFEAQIDGTKWHFTNQLEDNSYYYLNRYGRYDKIIMAPSAIFTGYEAYASGRGYIWSRTIPLLKNKIILGSGADTFVLAFPQQDYVNLNNYRYGTSLITKPHSLYLQIGVQTGVISLLAFLIFYIIYFISSFKLYINSKYDNTYSKVGVAILAGTFGYMICGISNDSSITVAPVFWALMGVGIAVNKKSEELQKANK
jgi:hypothetical protein